MVPSIYLDLEDDVKRVVQRIKRARAQKVVLVCPKRCLLFSDGVNLKLLKKETDLLGTEVAVLTMDERGQSYAREAGFELRSLGSPAPGSVMSDLRAPRRAAPREPSGGVPAAAPRAPAGAAAVKVMPAEPAFVAPVVSSVEPTRFEDGADGRDNIFPAAELHEVHEAEASATRTRRWLVALTVGSVAVAACLAFVVLPAATVAVQPKSEHVTRDYEVSIGTSYQVPSADRLQLPAVPLKEDLAAAGKFESQGKREVGNRASGTVRIYNFTRSPITLKASSTQLSAGGVSYLLVKDIVYYPATRYKNERTKEIDEASLGAAAEVVAAAGGESGNLPPGSRIEITNKVFGSNPVFLYAKVADPVAGGTSRYLSYVSDQDLGRAQANLGEAAVATLSQQLSGRGLALAGRSFSVENVRFTADRSVGDQNPGFSATLTASSTGIAYRTDELKQVIEQRLKQTLPENRELEPNPDIRVTLRNYDAASGSAQLLVRYSGQVSASVDTLAIPGLVAGKSREDAAREVAGRFDVEQVDFTLSPAWQSRLPFISGRISVEINHPAETEEKAD